MPTTNENLRDSALRHKIYMLKHETYLYNQMLSSFLDQLDRDLVDKIRKQTEIIKTRGTGVFVLKKYKALLEFVREITKNQSDEMLVKLRSDMRELGLFERDWELKNIQSATIISLDLVTPSPSFLSTIIETEPLEGKLLKEWVEDWGINKKNRVTREIRIGLVEGETSENIVKRLTGTKANKYRDGALDISRRGARTLVRTVSNAVSTKARENVYKQNDDVLKGVQWVSTLDNLTTPICQARDGKIYPIDDGPRPPAHINCRSTTVPVMKSFKEMGIDLNDFPEGERPAVVDNLATQVSSKETYQTWLKKQSESFQNEVLGKKRAKLFREGNLTLDKFVDMDTGRKYTLDEIRKRQPEVWEKVF